MSKLKNYPDLIENYSSRILIVFTGCFLSGLVFVIGLNHPFWGDERHFVATIRYFGKHFSINTLADYDQVTGPLVFILYMLWGKITSFSIAHLRLLSLVFSAAALILTFYWFTKTLNQKKMALLAMGLIMINPYMWGLSFFVFTDIPTLCFLVLIGWAVLQRQSLLLFIATAMALLSRQYAVYVVVAAGLYQLVELFKGKKENIIYIAALIAGCAPLIVLMIIWGGPAPPKGTALWAINDNHLYHFSYLTTYITFTAVYCLPLLFISGRRLLHNKLILIICFILSFWFFLFPIHPSYAALTHTNFETVGLLHRVIRTILKAAILENFFLWLMFLSGLILIANMIYTDFKRFKQGYWDYGHFLTLSVIFFLLIMPFSYQVWEKYLIIVLPFIILRLMLMKLAYRKIPESSS